MLQRDGFVGAIYFVALVGFGREGSVESRSLRIPPNPAFSSQGVEGTFSGSEVPYHPFLGFFGSHMAGEIPGLPFAFSEAL